MSPGVYPLPRLLTRARTGTLASSGSGRPPSPTRAGARRRRSRPGCGARRASGRARRGPPQRRVAPRASAQPVAEPVRLGCQRLPVGAADRPRHDVLEPAEDGAPAAGGLVGAEAVPRLDAGAAPGARLGHQMLGIAERELEAAVADGEQQRLALAGDDRHRQVGVVRGELGGGHAAPAERPREAEDGVAEVGDRADRRRQLARDRVGPQRGGRRGPDLGQRARRGGDGQPGRDGVRLALGGELDRAAGRRVEHRGRLLVAEVDEQHDAQGVRALRERPHRRDRVGVAGDRLQRGGVLGSGLHGRNGGTGGPGSADDPCPARRRGPRGSVDPGLPREGDGAARLDLVRVLPIAAQVGQPHAQPVRAAPATRGRARG